MQQHKKILAVLCAALCVLALAGCASTAASAPGTLTDLAGRGVTLDKTPETLVSLTASTTETLFALGLGGKVIGVDESSNYPAEAADIAKIGDFSGPNVEKIVDLAPDLVLAGNKLQTDAMTSLDAVGVTNAATEATDYAGIYDSIALIGKMTGATGEADKLVADIKAREDAVTAKVAGKEVPTVYIIISYGEYGNWTSGPGSYYNDIVTKAGGVCVTDTVDPSAPWMELDMEKIMELDPDIILLADGFSTADALTAVNGYQDMRAVLDGKVFVVDADVMSRPGPRVIEALETVAKILHPDAF